MARERDDRPAHVTPEVGDEGGSPGDIEIGVDRKPAAGSEATETWQPQAPEKLEIVRDETGEGRRSP
jgi:hypothetical protein